MPPSPKTATLLREPLLSLGGSHSTLNLGVRIKRAKFSATAPDLRDFKNEPLLEEETSVKPATFMEAFRELPKEVYVVFLVDFLNSYRSFGFRTVQYQFLVNEFGMSDVDTGSLLGLQAWLMVVFGMIGAMMVDAYGVRNTALYGLSISVVGRGMIVFFTDHTSLLVSQLILSPFGEAVLSTGIYTVALKRLTTPRTRALAFGVQYGVLNLAGAIADIAADALRKHDIVLPAWVPLAGGATWSGLRIHVAGTWLAVVVCLFVVVFFLFDTTLTPLDENVKFTSSPNMRVPPATLANLRAHATPLQLSRGFLPVRSRVAPEGAAAITSVGGLVTWCKGACGRAAASLKDLWVMRAFWRALWLSTCLFWISKQWGDMDQLLPPFLERYYGESVPYYTIHSINLWICMLGPSVAASLTTHMEDFDVILPGLWVMSIAPAWLAVDPSVPAAVAFVTLLSVGEVFWAPRQGAWVASIAPDGREGIFMAMLSLKSLITTVPSTAFNGWLNSAFNPNCESCRDAAGHFCADDTVTHAAGAVHYACRTANTLCVGGHFNPALSAIVGEQAPICPSTCQECPGWEGGATTMWLIVLLTSVSSPLLVALTLRFLRKE